jgi:hypothetical protein
VTFLNQSAECTEFDGLATGETLILFQETKDITEPNFSIQVRDLWKINWAHDNANVSLR